LSRWFPAAAGAVLLIGIVCGAVLLMQGAVFLLGKAGRRVVRSGVRGGEGRLADALTAAAGCGIGGASGLGLLGLAIWSFAAVWRFPQSLPEGWTIATWTGHAAGLWSSAGTTLWLGAAATALALPLVVACLERERRRGIGRRRWTWALYAPLVAPQMAFLFGMQIAMVRLRLDGGVVALVWAHLVFVLPYVFLALADPWRALDPRLLRTAACLGAPPWRVLWRVTLPLLLRPLLAAAATGFAVSAGLYLPTLFAGAGRWETLATAAVTLSSGGDRRIVAATALLQALLPLGAFAAALALPNLTARRRSALAIAA
jgi:putative thiamine transport system permease protein